MRPGQKNRSRGGRNNNMMGGGGGGNYQNNRGPRPPNRSQNFDSSGPSVKIRGNAYQVFERYIAMAREASSSGDRVAAENLGPERMRKQSVGLHLCVSVSTRR